ncbi:arylsulfotransferase family protein [Pseudoruegeria sp. HB172150]|uniref:arylsulfotransferase family protein n=1 Tax=Pseudoruegeria sp. HB172150 TaxID=2721164 RepID=UPI00155327DD|nr:arylsulfotransferase family protein [Pseudoruegeria sp. HB172150]
MAGLALLVLLSAALGFSVAHRQLWPYVQILRAQYILYTLWTYGDVPAAGRRHLAPSGAARVPAVIHDPDSVIGEGHYAFLAWDAPRAAYSIFLRDASGELVHTWPVDEMAITDRAEHHENAPHAMEVLPDGTALVSFDWLGLIARLDACGDPIWSREGFFHHAFSPAADGGIWTWYGAGSAYGQMQAILKFDPLTGEDLTRIDFRDDIVLRSPDSALLFSMYPDFPFVPDDARPPDIFHPNDVEELLPELAPAFPMFEAGDLLISIRELDMVAVITPSGQIKWHQHGPWLKQHDPDFEADGTIAVYNNSRDRPRSSIIAVDPATGAVSNAAPGFDGPFKSAYRGKHQVLPNGNRLITIPEQGQAIEIAAGGSVVAEFNNVVPGSPDYNDDFANAKWLPAGYFETVPACPG